jgi:glutamyl-tRNA synthetase
MLRTRLAPTPSGDLHLGNAWSFVLTWLAARSQQGRVHLRIDDLDAARARDEHLEDIFESLRWLGLDWDSGPRDVAEFRAAYSQRQRLRLDRYQDALEALRARGKLYVCTCSRAQIQADTREAGTGAVYPGTCRPPEFSGGRGGSAVTGTTGEHTLRFHVPGGAVRVRDADGGLFELHPDRAMGDFVIRRRNGDPAYQLASLLDDEDLGVNFVVRGLDLMPSTGAQASLAAALGLTGFAQARFWHHPLVVDDAGEKLSKSRGAESLRALRARFATPEPVYRWFAAKLGMSEAASARDLLPGFGPHRAPSHPLRLSDFWRSVASGG